MDEKTESQALWIAFTLDYFIESDIRAMMEALEILLNSRGTRL